MCTYVPIKVLYFKVYRTRATEEGLIGRNARLAQERTPEEGRRTDEGNDTTEELNKRNI